MAPRFSRARRANGARGARGARGAISLEFLLCFFPLLLCGLGAVQLFLLALAAQIVDHACTRAARASLTLFFEQGNGFEDVEPGDCGAESARREAVTDAAEAIIAVLPHPNLKSGAIENAFDAGNILERGLGASLSLAGLVALSFDEGRDGTEVSSLVGVESPRVKVSYLHRCRIPLVNRLICKSGHEILLSRTWKGAESPYAHLDNVESESLRDLALLTGERYYLLQSSKYFYPHRAEYFQ